MVLLLADDTTIYHSKTNINELIATVKVELVKVKNWVDKNKLFLNWDKTKHTIYSNYQIDGNSMHQR